VFLSNVGWAFRALYGFNSIYSLLLERPLAKHSISYAASKEDISGAVDRIERVLS
jgi:hypothetical protein